MYNVTIKIKGQCDIEPGPASSFSEGIQTDSRSRSVQWFRYLRRNSDRVYLILAPTALREKPMRFVDFPGYS